MSKTKYRFTYDEVRVIVIEIPEEMEEIFRYLAGSLVGRCDKTIEKRLEAEDDDEDWEDNKTGELASRIAAVLAHRAVDNLMTIAENLTVETMVAITKYLLSMDAERLVSMLKGLFLSHGMYEAAGELDLLDICSEYEEDAVCFFEEAFYDTDSMDWYSIGRRNNAKYQERHKEEIKEKKRKYYEEHRDEILDYHKKYYMEHKDEINAERTIV